MAADGVGLGGTSVTGGTDGTGQVVVSGKAVEYTEIWSGSKKIDWGANGLAIDHALFTKEFNALRVTYSADSGAVKMAVCDPWTDIVLTADSISGGSVADDGALNLPTGQDQTITIKMSAADVAGIKGQEQDGAWGGLKIYGAETITLKKIETFKDSEAESAPEPVAVPEPVPETSGDVVLFESAEGWTEDWNAKNFGAAKFAAAVAGSKIKFTVRKNTDQYVTEDGEGNKNYSNCYSIIQLLNGDNKLTGGTIEGGEIEVAGGNLKPLYKNADNSDDYDESHVFTMVYSPSAEEITAIKESGIGVQAHGTRILKIEFIPSSK